MEKNKRILSLVLSLVLVLSTVLIPGVGVADVTAAPAQSGSTQTIHPFNGTDALIRDTIEELAALGKTTEAQEEDKELAARVERDSDLSYEEARSAVYGALTADYSASQADMSALGLSEDVMSDLVDRVLADNYLAGAFTDLTYTVENGKVTKVNYEISEGFASAMEAYASEIEMEVDLSDVTPDTVPETVQEEQEVKPSMFNTLALYDDTEESACAYHTVAGNDLGDYNKDGEINLDDVDAFRLLVLTDPASAYDFNEDGKINIGDVAKFRMKVQNGELSISAPEVTFTWKEEPVKDSTPITDDEGNVTNGGLLYDHETGEVSQGILPDVYYELESISFDCAVCGEHIEITDAETLAQFTQPMDVYLNMANYETLTVEAGSDPGFSEEEAEYWILYTEIELAAYVDDTFSMTTVPDADGNPVVGEDGNPVMVPATDENGNVIGMYTSNMDNGAAEVTYYYGVLSTFINDKVEYFGTPTDYFTSKNSDGNPMGALKSVCNVDPDTQVPPAQMTMMVRDLPQAFMAYYWQYGEVLAAVRDAAIESIPEGLTEVQELLYIHDWLAENAIFDMGAMTARDEDGNPAESDPIQMTTFGALLSTQLQDSYGSGYYGGLCPSYAAAYNLLVQAAHPEIYQVEETDADGETTTRWATVKEVDENGGDIVDFVQVLFYTNTAETSIAGEGFGGGWFNNVHYFNAAKLVDQESEGVGNWYYVDACYDDIYIECLEQYRGESDGSVSHTYFLLSPQTMATLYGDNVECIDSLYDGYTYVQTDETYQPGDDKYNPEDPEHLKYEKVENPNETGYDDQSYEDSWFSGAVSKISWDEDYFYYVDGGASAAAYADLIDQMNSDDGSSSDLGDSLSMTDMMHGSRVDVEEQNLLKRRSRTSPDYWEDTSSSDTSMSIVSSKEDTYAETLFDYGTGVMKNSDLVLADEVIEDFVLNEQYPALTHTVALYNDKLYFNLSNDIYVCNTDGSGLQLFKEYNEVTYTSDGRTFTATSYDTDENGELSVTNKPIGALAIHTTYTPQYTPVDYNGQTVYIFTGLTATDVMTVNIATNFSFTNTNESGDRYAVEAVNLNPDYQLYGSSHDEDENDNSEFMWCAVIRDDMTMEELLSATGSNQVNVPATCTRPAYTDVRTDSGVITSRTAVEGSEPNGHSYVYDETEGVYLCEDCQLHATVKVEDTENGSVTLYATTTDGMEGLGDSLGSMGSFGEEVIPVSTVREAETKKTGEIQIICQPDEGYRVAKVEYRSATAAEDAEYTPIEADENGEYKLEKEEGCISIRVTFEKIYTVTVEPAENGAVTLEGLTPTAEGSNVYEVAAGTEVTLTAAANDGYAAEAPEVTGAELNPGQTEGTYTFVMPEADVTVTGKFVKASTVTLASDANSTVTAAVGEQAVTSGGTVKAGETVSLTVGASDGYQVESVTVDSADVTKVNDTTYTFVMPEADVTVTVKATQDVVPPETYNVTVNTVGGGTSTAKANVTEAEAGATVTITATPAEGYQVAGVTVDGEAVSENDDGTYTFEMPDADVTVTVTFAAVEAEPDPDPTPDPEA